MAKIENETQKKLDKLSEVMKLDNKESKEKGTTKGKPKKKQARK